MAMDTTTKTTIKHSRRTTRQLFQAAAKDTDAVSVFYDGVEGQPGDCGVLVVKGGENLAYLVSIAKRQGMLTDKPVEFLPAA